MSVWAGIDMGTSGIKVALFDDAERILASVARKTEVDRRHPGWSEQHPTMWWEVVSDAFDELAGSHPTLMARLAGIGLSGQMLGLVLLDDAHNPLRNAILWNDQRALDECDELLRRVPDIGWRCNGAPDPGIIGPKLIWMARHEPEVLDSAAMLLLPKDYVRLRLTGSIASEPTDAAGTMLMDCASRSWDGELCGALGWDIDRLPPIVDSWSEAGRLRADLAQRWGTPKRVPVAAGAGDNMACTIGAGAARPGDVVISLGTSGVVNAVDGAFHPAPEDAVLTAPHAAPDTFLSMGVVMSATASLDWLAAFTGIPAIELAEEAEVFAGADRWHDAPLFRPSLSGIRTPHNRPDVAGMIDGINPVTDRAALCYALMEGVVFQFVECVDAQIKAGVAFDKVQLVGGGSNSRLWAQLVATLTDKPLTVPRGSALSANIGAARLGRIAAVGATTEILSQPLPGSHGVEVRIDRQERLRRRYEMWRDLPLRTAPSLKDQGLHRVKRA